MTGQGTSIEAINRLIEHWYTVGLEAVDPQRAVERAMAWDGRSLRVDATAISIADSSRVVAVAFGKAAAGMARGLESEMGQRLNSRIILTKDGHAENSPSGWTVYEASHPVPDDRGVNATRHILSELGALDAGDLAIVLVSGGGSALLESPANPLTLKDLQDTTRLLLQAGASIQHLNTVRRELSDVKGGGLRRTIGDATCVSLILSDVLGNDPATIASGPTIARSPDPDAARKMLETYGLTDQAPGRVLDVLNATSGTLEPPDVTRDVYAIVGDNAQFIDRIEAAVRESGCRPVVALRNAEGEARELASTFIDLLDEQEDDVDVVIGGGEATVTVRGDGIGGRNTEFALAAAGLLTSQEENWVIASLASDGQDGAIDAAGAIVDWETVARGRRVGLDADEFLDNNDSGRFFELVGGLVAPGPTGTNVNDVYVAVRMNQSTT